MEQKDDEVSRLEELASETTSFEEYLRAAERTEACQPVNGVEVKSSNEQSQPVEMVSGDSGNVVGATESSIDVRREWMNKPGYLESGLRTESLAHPTAPFVSAEAAAAGQVKDVQEYATRLELHDHPIVGQYLTETQVPTNQDPDEYLKIFTAGKSKAVVDMSAEQVLDWIHAIDEAIRKLKITQQGARAGLEEHLKGSSSKRRAEISEHDKRYRSPKKSEDGEERVKRAKPSTAGKSKGMKLADTLVTGMGFSKDEVLAKLKETSLLDAETESYINTKLFA